MNVLIVAIIVISALWVYWDATGHKIGKIPRRRRRAKHVGRCLGRGHDVPLDHRLSYLSHEAIDADRKGDEPTCRGEGTRRQAGHPRRDRRTVAVAGGGRGNPAAAAVTDAKCRS